MRKFASLKHREVLKELFRLSLVNGFEGPVSTCFPPALGLNVAQNGPFTDEWQEPIAADARVGGDGKRLAEQKVIAALLGLPLDEVIRRAERARKKLGLIRNSIIAALLLLTLASVGGFT